MLLLTKKQKRFLTFIEEELNVKSGASSFHPFAVKRVENLLILQNISLVLIPFAIISFIGFIISII